MPQRVCAECQRPVTGRTRYCRKCYRKVQSEFMRRRWQDPAYRFAQAQQLRSRNRPVHNAWLKDEDTLLRQLAGNAHPSEISRRCAEVSGIARSHLAIQRRAQLLGLSLMRNFWTQIDVARIFGVSTDTVVGWRVQGYLVMGRYGLNYSVTEDAIKAFIREWSWLFDADRMARGPFRSLAEVVQRRDPWWTTARVRRELGISRTTLYDGWRRGFFTTRRRNGSHGGTLVIRAVDLDEWQRHHAESLKHWRERRLLNLIPGGKSARPKEHAA